MSDKTLLRGASVFDGHDLVLGAGDVLVVDQRIVGIGARLSAGEDAKVIDLTGHFLMPGLIDAHVHVCANDLDVAKTTSTRWRYLAALGFANMRQRLDAGFTTLRDMSGADLGMARALKDGLVEGPRLFYSGKLISQTGGHADSRSAPPKRWLVTNPMRCRHWRSSKGSSSEGRLRVSRARTWRSCTSCVSTHRKA